MAILIDDFSTGPDSFELTTGVNDRQQTGNSIIGGTRRTILRVSQNPLNQPAHVDVSYGSLNVSTGVNQLHRLEVFYGKVADSNSQMSLDLRGLDLFRFHFLPNNLVLNFNLQVLTGTLVSSAKIDSGSPDLGVNLPGSLLPFTHDFLLAAFDGDADLSAIDSINLIFQNGIAGQDYAINKIELI